MAIWSSLFSREGIAVACSGRLAVGKDLMSFGCGFPVTGQRSRSGTWPVAVWTPGQQALPMRSAR